MKKYINPLLTFGTTMALLYVIYGQNEELIKLRKVETVVASKPDSLQKMVDSLETELFMSQTMNGRYELSLEHLHEVNQKAGLEFQRFMENETE
jgi:hypothetical protein